MTISFEALRAANTERLPQFRNGRGELAHSKPDGSDWTPAQWLQALVGELGEYATVRAQFERNEISFEDYEAMAAKELADVQIYLDLLSRRALDKVAPGPRGSAPDVLLDLVAHLGEYANARKKFERGDHTVERLNEMKAENLGAAESCLHSLQEANHSPISGVAEAHPTGVNLGMATLRKFNEVSLRVGCSVFMQAPLRFEHYKGGIYELQSEALLESDRKTVLAIYKAPDGKMVARDQQEFYEVVERDGVAVPRFKLVTEQQHQGARYGT